MLRARSLLIVLSLAIPTLAGCAAAPYEPPADADEDAEPSGDAVTIAASSQARFTTTANLNFRSGPSRSESIMRVLPRGTTVTRIQRTPEGGFFKVTQGGDEGWVHGNYIRAEGAAGGDDATTPNPTDTGTGTGQVESCKASFYDEGQQTANGERFDPSAMTAAHKTLKFNTRVRVTNKANGKSVTVRINDRGPFVAGRCIDLSRAAFSAISSTGAGVASVTVEVLR